MQHANFTRVMSLSALAKVKYVFDLRTQTQTRGGETETQQVALLLNIRKYKNN